jgi:hypothetical protein
MDQAISAKMADDLRNALDYIDIRHDWTPFEDVILNLPPDRRAHIGQREFLEGSIHRQNGLHPGNGWGKTSVLAKKHIYFILKHFSDQEKYKTLNVAITQDQAELVQDEIISLVKHSDFLRGWFIPDNGVVKFPHARIRYGNGATTEFKTTKKKGESIEGKQYGYISADEIALEVHLEFIAEKILLPRLRAWTDSQLDFSATPKGYTAFYRILENIKRAGGYVRGGSSYENPHIDHTLLDYFKRTWTPEKFEQVIEGKFIETSDMMFASRVSRLFDESLDFEEVMPGCEYIEGWDLARGRKRGSDFTVGYRLKKGVPYVVTKRWGFQLPWTEKERELINAQQGAVVERSSVEREIRNAQLASGAESYIDSTGVGDTLYGMVQDIAKGVDFRGGRKDELLDHLQAVIDADLIKSPFIPQLAEQMTMYQRDDKLIATDDLMSLAIACSSIDVQSSISLSMIGCDVFASGQMKRVLRKQFAYAR